MAYIKHGLEVGDTVILEREVSCMAGTFTKGSKVKIVGSSYRGYNIEDEEGNRIIEVGYDIGRKLNE
jgi:hypothetical protein